MRLLLTSTGLTNKNIVNQFLNIINKEPSKIKIIFIPTAARSEEELNYVNESKEELLNLGILEKNIKNINLNKKVEFNEVKNFDVIYVCGGNTFYLLKKIKETNFDQIIKEFLKSGKLYFGVSAGSIIVCPNIEIAIPFDENDVHLEDLSGLNLINVIVSPHYDKKEKTIIEKFKKRSDYRLVTITDNQALLIINGKSKIIGDD